MHVHTCMCKQFDPIPIEIESKYNCSRGCSDLHVNHSMKELESNSAGVMNVYMHMINHVHVHMYVRTYVHCNYTCKSYIATDAMVGRARPYIICTMIYILKGHLKYGQLCNQDSY